jgi:hypothetical protein
LPSPRSPSIVIFIGPRFNLKSAQPTLSLSL